MPKHRLLLNTEFKRRSDRVILDFIVTILTFASHPFFPLTGEIIIFDGIFRTQYLIFKQYFSE